MNIIAIIPARMGSSRFPGKPLANICGIPMLGRVYAGVSQASLISKVFIATCDQEISDYASSINAPWVMTADTHERCTDRTAEAMLKIEEQTGEVVDLVVMVQGDEPMVTGKMVDDAIKALIADKEIDVVNLMASMNSVADFEDPNEVKVVVDNNNYALYFSREPIPSRKKGYENVSMHKQVCIIPFRREFLLEFNSMAETPLERYESVDMMRILENGKKVKMVKTEIETFSIDTPQDLARVEEILAKDKVVA